jgi:cytochrome c556
MWLTLRRVNRGIFQASKDVVDKNLTLFIIPFSRRLNQNHLQGGQERMEKPKRLYAAFFAGLFLLIATQAFGQADVIEKRQKAMKANSADAKAIKAALEAKDYATIEVKAKEIMSTAEKIPDLFPKGSTQGKTKAKAEIWEKWDEFKGGASKLKTASGDLAKAAAAKDHDKVEAGVKAVSGTCGGCHKAFRAEKYSE